MIASILLEPSVCLSKLKSWMNELTGWKMLLGSGAENHTRKPSIGSITVPKPSRLDSSLMNAPAVAHDPHRISPTGTVTMSLENGADRVCIHAAWSEENEFAWYPAPTRGKARVFIILPSVCIAASSICRNVPSFSRFPLIPVCL